MSSAKQYIAYLDLLGTKGFCEQEDLYYKNIKKFSRSIETLAPLLASTGRIGIFSDCVYIESSQLDNMLLFLTKLRAMLIGDELFFNAALSKGQLGVESIGYTPDDNSNLFGVRFTNKEIASIYCKQTKFRGVGIWIDQNVLSEINSRKNIKIVKSLFYNKEIKNDIVHYTPKPYNDIAFFPTNNNPDEKYKEQEIKNILSIIFKTIYTSHCKSSQYSVYYISLLINIIRCCNVEKLTWNKTNEYFENMSKEFEVMYSFLIECNTNLNNFIGFDSICLTFLDTIYKSPKLTCYDKAAITELFINKFSCLKEKYKYSLETVPKEPFTENNRRDFINYCNNDMARQFVDKIIKD